MRWHAQLEIEGTVIIGVSQCLDESFVRDGIDIRLLARRQRLMLWLVLGSLASLALPSVADSVNRARGSPGIVVIATTLVLVGIRVAVVVGAVLVMRALRTNFGVLICCAILMILPVVNVLILLLEGHRAKRVLRRVGLRVGLMGVRDEDVVIRLGKNRCRQCGYNLTGNVSGICPECGTVIRARLPSRLREGE